MPLAYTQSLSPLAVPAWKILIEKSRRQFWKPVLMIIVVVLSIPFILVAFPYKTPAGIQEISERYKKFGLLRWEDGKDHNMPQDFADMLGWSELARKTDSVYSLVSDKENTIVLCDNYGQAGAINYYSRFKNIDAVSFNADYINWMPLEKKITNMIFVADADQDQATIDMITSIFNAAGLTDSITNSFAREMGAKIYLFENAKTDINKILSKRIKEYKEAYK